MMMYDDKPNITENNIEGNDTHLLKFRNFSCLWVKLSLMHRLHPYYYIGGDSS